MRRFPPALPCALTPIILVGAIGPIEPQCHRAAQPHDKLTTTSSTAHPVRYLTTTVQPALYIIPSDLTASYQSSIRPSYWTSNSVEKSHSPCYRGKCAAQTYVTLEVPGFFAILILRNSCTHSDIVHSGFLRFMQTRCGCLSRSSSSMGISLIRFVERIERLSVLKQSPSPKPERQTPNAIPRLVALQTRNPGSSTPNSNPERFNPLTPRT